MFHKNPVRRTQVVSGQNEISVCILYILSRIVFLRWVYIFTFNESKYFSKEYYSIILFNLLYINYINLLNKDISLKYVEFVIIIKVDTKFNFLLFSLTRENSLNEIFKRKKKSNWALREILTSEFSWVNKISQNDHFYSSVKALF